MAARDRLRLILLAAGVLILFLILLSLIGALGGHGSASTYNVPPVKP